MKLLTILAISMGLLTASQAMEKPSFHTKCTPSSDCPVMKCVILCKCGGERYEVSVFLRPPDPRLLRTRLEH